jgi:hypothetical protein
LPKRTGTFIAGVLFDHPSGLLLNRFAHVLHVGGEA